MPRAFVSVGGQFVSLGGQGIILHELDAVLDAVRAKDPGLRKVCVVEGIDGNWTQALQDSLLISDNFFQDYRKNPEADNPWEEIFNGPAVTRSHIDQPNFHIAGVLEYPGWIAKKNAILGYGHHRRCWTASDPFPISSNTVISCILVKREFCR